MNELDATAGADPVSTIPWDLILPYIVSFFSSFVLGWLVLTVDRSSCRSLRAGAVGLGCAMLFSYPLYGWTSWEVGEHWTWIYYLIASAMIIGPACLYDSVPNTEWIGLRLLLAAATAWFLTPDWLPPIEDPADQTLLVDSSRSFLLLLALTFIVMVLLDIWAALRPGFALPTFLMFCLVSEGVILATGGNNKLGEFAFLAAAAMPGIISLAAIEAGRSTFRGAVPIVSVLLVGLAYCGYVNAYPTTAEGETPPLWSYSLDFVPVWSYLVITLAPLTLFLTLVFPVRFKTKFPGVCFALLLLAIPLTIAVLPAAWQIPELLAELQGDALP